MKNVAKCIIKVLVGLTIAGPSLSSPLLLPLRAARLSNALSSHAHASASEPSRFYDADWVKITEAPPRVVQQPLGERLELECEAVGASPTIRWVRGDAAFTETDSYESNAISEGLTQGLSKVRARLIINSVLAPHQGALSCVATSGAKTAVASTALYVVQGMGSPRNLSALLSLPRAQPGARVVLWSPVVMAPQGSEVLLPCQAVGEPTPDMFWLDASDELVNGQDPRIKVLASGELRIRNLAWQDMGAYTCVARNAFSKDSISSFVYPLLNEN